METFKVDFNTRLSLTDCEWPQLKADKNDRFALLNV